LSHSWKKSHALVAFVHERDSDLRLGCENTSV
jgi:hypothetical protein